MSSLILVLILAADAGTSLDATRARALGLYKAKKYAEACPLMKEVADQLKTDSEAWSDLGLCLLRKEPYIPPPEAHEALQRAWSTAITPAQRSAALFNLTLFHRIRVLAPTRLTDPRCPDSGVLLNSAPWLHSINRSTANTIELTACAVGVDGGCDEERTSRLSLGGDPEKIDLLPMAHCYLEAEEERACEELLGGDRLTRAEKAAVAKAGSCEAIKKLPVFARRVKEIDKNCDSNSSYEETELRKLLTELPRWVLQEVDVCAEQVRVNWGKKKLEFKLGNQTDEMGARPYR